MDKFEEKTLSSKTVYKGKIFEITDDEITLSDGLVRHREIIHHPGGVVIFALKDNYFSQLDINKILKREG